MNIVEPTYLYRDTMTCTGDKCGKVMTWDAYLGLWMHSDPWDYAARFCGSEPPADWPFTNGH